MPINVQGEVVCTVATDPNNSGTLYAGTCEDFFGGEVYKTANGGANWTQNQPIPGFTNVSTLAIDPSDSDIVFAGHNCSGISRSEDGGTTWMSANNGLTIGCFLSIAFAPSIINPPIMELSPVPTNPLVEMLVN